MPVLMGSDMQTGIIAGASGFNFTGKRIEKLTQTEYTLATIALDETGSVLHFENILQSCLNAAVDGCKMSPRSDNIMVRVLYFGSQYGNGVEEIHGFTPVNEINTADYPLIKPRGWTTLNDACYSGIGAINAYGDDLRKQNYSSNGILVVITDGVENMSTATEAMVKQELESTVKDEKLESMLSILVGVNAAQHKRVLEDYQQKTGINHYIDAGQATAENMAKLGGFISQSISSQSQALGTGGPSQIPNI